MEGSGCRTSDRVKYHGVGALALCAAWCSPAFAQANAPQQAPNAGDGIAEIIVTAERRSSTIQKTPIAITALAGEDLAKNAIVALNDALSNVVGTSIQGNANGAYIYIRGIGSSQDANIGGPAVNLNVDGIYQQQPDAPLSAIYDVQRVEVLRGPQGTLYGRNATAGSINIVTKDPSLIDSTADMRLLYGNYRAIQAEAAVNVPLSDTLAVRVAALTNSHDGYLHPSGYNDANDKAVRAKILFKPSDFVGILAGGEYIDIDENGTSGVMPGDQAAFDNYYAAQPVGVFRVKMKRAYVQADFDLGIGTLTLLPAIQRYEKFDDRIIVAPAPNTPVNLVNETQKTIEARLASSTGSPFTWVVGGYFLDSKLDDPIYPTSATGRPAQFGSIAGATTRSYAAFGQATVPVVDHLRLTGGLRFTRDEKSLTARSGQFGKVSFDSFTYKAGIEYDVSPHSLLYANLSTGFKSGGLDERFQSYSPEKLRSISIGSKNRFLNDRLQVNAEAFHYRYTGFQASYGARCQNSACTTILNFANAISNAGNAKVYGIEAEVVARPWSGATISTAGSYTHSRLSDLIIDPGTARDLSGTPTAGCSRVLTCPFLGTTILTGQQFANAPEWTFQFRGEQKFKLAGAGEIRVSADTKYSSGYITSYSSQSTSYQPAFWRTNANIAYTFPDTDLTISGFVKNIENNAILLTVVGPARVIGAPRTYGVQLAAHF